MDLAWLSWAFVASIFMKQNWEFNLDIHTSVLHIALFLKCNFYVPERSFMHLTVSCWFLISSGWVGGWGGNSRRGRSEGKSRVFWAPNSTRLSARCHFTMPKKLSISFAQVMDAARIKSITHGARGRINHRCINSYFISNILSSCLHSITNRFHVSIFFVLLSLTMCYIAE